jgi:hypothetical protein
VPGDRAKFSQFQMSAPHDRQVSTEMRLNSSGQSPQKVVICQSQNEVL